MDILPGEWYGTDKEEAFNIPIQVGDFVMIVVDSQFNDRLTRFFGHIGNVIEIDPSDEWAYKVQCQEGGETWFKRHCLQKV